MALFTVLDPKIAKTSKNNRTVYMDTSKLLENFERIRCFLPITNPNGGLCTDPFASFLSSWGIYIFVRVLRKHDVLPFWKFGLLHIVTT